MGRAEGILQYGISRKISGSWSHSTFSDVSFCVTRIHTCPTVARRNRAQIPASAESYVAYPKVSDYQHWRYPKASRTGHRIQSYSHRLEQGANLCGRQRILDLGSGFCSKLLWFVSASSFTSMATEAISGEISSLVFPFPTAFSSRCDALAYVFAARWRQNYIVRPTLRTPSSVTSLSG